VFVLVRAYDQNYVQRIPVKGKHDSRLFTFINNSFDPPGNALATACCSRTAENSETGRNGRFEISSTDLINEQEAVKTLAEWHHSEWSNLNLGWRVLSF